MSNFRKTLEIEIIKRYDRLIDKDKDIKYVNMSKVIFFYEYIQGESCSYSYK